MVRDYTRGIQHSYHIPQDKDLYIYYEHKLYLWDNLSLKHILDDIPHMDHHSIQEGMNMILHRGVLCIQHLTHMANVNKDFQLEVR